MHSKQNSAMSQSKGRTEKTEISMRDSKKTHQNLTKPVVDRSQKNVLIHEHVEYLILLIAGPVLGYIMNAQDPFFLQASFQWLMLPLMFITLRWGFERLFISLAIYAGTFTLYHGFVDGQWLPEALSMTTIIGPTLVLLVTSLCADSLLTQLRRLRSEKEELTSNLRKVVSRFRLLKVSHDSAVSALVTHNKHAIFSDVHKTYETLQLKYTNKELKDIPHLLSEQVKVFNALDIIECAGLYPVVKSEKALSKPIASIGDKKPLNSSVMIVKRALLTQGITFVDDTRLGDNIAQSEHDNILSVVPLINDKSVVYAVLCVYSFKSETTTIQQQAALHYAQTLCHDALVVHKGENRQTKMRVS